MRSALFVVGGAIREHLDAIDGAEAFGATFADVTPIGSHCDLNARNVVFAPVGLVLVARDARRARISDLRMSLERGGCDGSPALSRGPNATSRSPSHSRAAHACVTCRVCDESLTSPRRWGTAPKEMGERARWQPQPVAVQREA